MRTNKLKLLTISLFLNNIKSVRIQHSNGRPYKYIETQTNMKATNPNGTIIEHIMDEHIQKKMMDILENLIAEIQKLTLIVQESSYIFEIENNRGTFTYQVTKKNGLTIINLFNPNQQGNQATQTTQYDNINNTVLALSYINSYNMQSFLKENASSDINIPNSNVFIYNQTWLVTDSFNNFFYIFNENNIEAKKNIERLLYTKEDKKEKEEIVPLFDKRNFTFQNIIMMLTLCTTIIVPLIVAKMTKN